MYDESRLLSLKRLLTQVRDLLELDLGFILWDGSTLPAVLAVDVPSLRIADEGVVAALVRRPTLETLVDLWAVGRIDLCNGSLFDVMARRPKVRLKRLLSSLDKSLVLGVATKFMFVSRGGPWPRSARDRIAASNSENADRNNIQYHYDVSNDFYALFLDPEMVYSCAYFGNWSDDLTTAQRNKLEMSCRRLQLKPGEILLDIGCGWGALICHAAEHYGVRAHGLTLSQKQYDYAQDKIARLKLQDRVTIELRDYAEIDGSFDKVVSIGMFEHVKLDEHAAYFATINRVLKPDGLYLHHAIVRLAKRNDRTFRWRRAEQQAITRYIFPGAELDHIGSTISNLNRAGFEIHDVEGWREHYARTCRFWHDRLLANRGRAEKVAGPERTRLWIAYLAGFSIGFERGRIGVFQTLASKRGRSGLPPTRADLYR